MITDPLQVLTISLLPSNIVLTLKDFVYLIFLLKEKPPSSVELFGGTLQIRFFYIIFLITRNW